MSKERLTDSYAVYKERGGKHSRDDFYKFFWRLLMPIDEILIEEKRTTKKEHTRVRVADCCLICKHKAIKYSSKGEEHCTLLNRWIFRHSTCGKFSPTDEQTY